jgi:hypothetical protein
MHQIDTPIFLNARSNTEHCFDQQRGEMFSPVQQAARLEWG